MYITKQDISYLELDNQIILFDEKELTQPIALGDLTLKEVDPVKFFGLVFKKINNKLESTHSDKRLSYYFNKEEDVLTIKLYRKDKFILQRVFIGLIEKKELISELFVKLIFIGKNATALSNIHYL